MARPLTASHRRDLITGGAIVLVGVVYYSATFAIRRTDDIVTPATFPAIVGIALILLGGILVTQALMRRETPAEAVPGSSSTAGAAASAGEPGVVIAAPPEPRSKQVVLQFAIFFVYLAILIPVGFLLSTAAFLMGLTSLYAPDRWIRNLVFSVLFAAVVYFAFVYGLAVYLPAGILG